MDVRWIHDADRTFSVGTYNILMKDVKPHWHPHCKEQELAWEYREPLLRKAIIDMNVDILCLQEVHAIGGKTVVDDLLTELGYEFRCSARINPNSEIPSYCTYAVLLAVRVARPGIKACKWVAHAFSQTLALMTTAASVEAFKAQLGDHQVAVGCEVTIHGSPIFVVCTHITNASEERFRQITQLGILEQSLPRGIPVIVAGDFNFVPETECYDLVVSGTLSRSVGGIPLQLFCERFPPMHSAYAKLLGREPEFTNYVRKPELFVGTIDYVFFSDLHGELTLVDCLQLPRKDDIISQHKGGFPNESFPSDHLPIGAAFNFRSARREPLNITVPWMPLNHSIMLAEEPKVFEHLTDDGFPADKASVVFAVDLPESMVQHKSHVRNFFSSFGIVNHVHVRHDKQSGVPMNSAFVSFTTVREAESVIERSKGGMISANGQRVKVFPKK